MRVETYNISGEKVGTTELPERLFGARWNAALVKQVYEGEMANKRRPWAHAKTRGEVSGGGKKPWRQKGTGRARHGSIRSPLWVGGGTSHGPRNERTYEVKINKKMKRGALLSLLSKKIKDKEVVLMDDFNIRKPKTKEVFGILKNLRTKAEVYNIGIKGGKTVLALPKSDSVKNASHNLPFASYIEPRNLNITVLLGNKYVIFDKKSVEELETVFK